MPILGVRPVPAPDVRWARRACTALPSPTPRSKGARRSVELRPVPENDKLLSTSTPDASGRRREQQLQHGGSTHGPPAAASTGSAWAHGGSGGGASGGLGGPSTGSGALSGAGSGAAAPSTRPLRTVSTRGLGRASMRLAAAAVQNKVQQGMVDFKRLAANWKQRTVEEKFATAEREYVNEGGGRGMRGRNVWGGVGAEGLGLGGVWAGVVAELWGKKVWRDIFWAGCKPGRVMHACGPRCVPPASHGLLAGQGAGVGVARWTGGDVLWPLRKTGIRTGGL